MFTKKFRVKSNVALRGSEKKQLRNRLATLLCVQCEDNVNEIISSKEDITVLKVYLHKGNDASVYCISKNPMFFHVEEDLFPTVYFLWQYHAMIPVLFTHRPVISKLSAGADLMLPGVVFPENDEFPTFAKGDTVAVATEDTMVHVAVGISLMSSEEMLMSEDKRGKAVQILHTFGDYLWAMGEKTQPPQFLRRQCLQNKSETTFDLENQSEVSVDETQYDVESTTTRSVQMQLTVEEKSSESNDDQIDDSCEETLDAKQEVQSPEDEMNELLQMCFLLALKTKLKDKDLPILTSTFYRLHVLPICPKDKQLDIKKTSYKKLSRYLNSIQSLGLIEVKELSKGSDSITTVNRGHVLLRELQAPIPDPVEETTNSFNTETAFGVITQKEYEPPELVTVYGVNAATLKIFQDMNVAKGSVLTGAEVRKLVTDYVRDQELVKGKMVSVNPVLHDTLFGRGREDVVEMSWEELFKKLLSRMQLHHQMKFRGVAPVVRKGEPPSIDVSVQTRSGNKKVTLVKNLEGFLIRPQDFADKMRKAVQASTSLSLLPSSTPTKPLHQVLIQGNQTRAVESLLTVDYKLPRKYLKGLENAPKKKGKQK